MTNLQVSLLVVAAMIAFAGDRKSDGPTCNRDPLEIQKSADAVLPWEHDDVGQYWESRQKLYFVTAVSVIEGDKKALSPQPLPFAVTDAVSVSHLLCTFGYRPVGGNESQAILTGPRATQKNFNNLLEALQTVAADNDPLVVWYYSGHAIPDPNGNDLYLQFYDQKDLSINQGVSFRELVTKIRRVYPGQLTVILDACFSGTATTLSGLLADKMFQGTNILTSSSRSQFSYPIVRPSGDMSAFSAAMIDGLTADFDSLSADGSGIVTMDDLYRYTKVMLRKYYQSHQIAELMEPSLTEISDPLPLAYVRSHLTRPNAISRQAFTSIEFTLPSSSGFGGGIASTPSGTVTIAISSGGRLLRTVPFDQIVEPNGNPRKVYLRLPKAAGDSLDFSLVSRLGSIVTTENVKLTAAPDELFRLPSGAAISAHRANLGGIAMTVKTSGSPRQ